MRKLTLLSAALTAGTTGGSTPAVTVRTIELTPASASVGVGGTVVLSATARDTQGQTIPNVAFAWKSGNETVASVASGLVKGLGAGTTGITASAGGVTSSAATVTVTQRQPQPGGNFDLSLPGDKLPVVTGTGASLTVNVTRKNGFTGAVTLGMTGLPAGASAAPVTLAADQTSATVTVNAAANAPHSQPTPVTLTGTATGAQSVTKTITVTVRGPAGSLDTTFGSAGITVTPVGTGEDVPSAMAVQSGGGLIVVGSTASTVSDDFAVLRYTRDGALDPSFGSGGKVVIDFAGKADIARAVTVQGDGKIVVAGGATNAANEERFGVVRLNANGSLDPAFGSGGKVVTAFTGSSQDRAQAVLVQPDGRVVVGGSASFGASASGVDFALARLTASGALDAAFGTGGRVTTSMTSGGANDTVYALALQGGKIVAAGGEGEFKVARYTPNGTLDASFGSGGRVSTVFGGNIAAANALAVDAQGRLVLAGQSQNDTAAARLTENGALDTSFGDGGKQVIPVNPDNWDAAQGVGVQTDGKVVLGGWVYGVGSQSNFAVTRLNANGQPDTGFGEGGTTVTPAAPGVKPDEARALILQPDERIPATRIVAAGPRNDSNQDFALTRSWP